MSDRKQHAEEAGYIAERMNPFVPGTKVVIYRAAEQGLNTESPELKYAIVCDAHGELVGTTNLPMARDCMKRPNNFCDGCRKVEATR